MKLYALLPLALALTATPAAAQSLAPAEAAIKGHVAFLADDALKGREAGTPEHEIAARYVAAQMLAAGLEPAAGKDQWLQPVPLIASKPAAEPVTSLSGRGGAAVPLVFGQDYTIRPFAGPAEIDVSGPVVFVGHGAVDPANGIDDYKGLDVRGKVVAMLYSGPKGLNSEVAAHLGNRLDRAILARARGAAGVVYLYTDQLQGVLPFDRMKGMWDTRVMAWASAAGAPPRDLGAPAIAVMSFAGAEKLFAGARIAWSAVRAAAEGGRPLPRGPLAVSLTTRQRFAVQRLESSNVVGVLRGSDPRLRDEYVVLTGHLDHIGVTRPVNGDAINNGAMDNAIGIGSLLEVARGFQASGKAPRRSLLFIAVTAEEKGLVGSDYYAQHPTVPVKTMVANVNLDMPILTYRFTDLVAFGAERSSIGPAASAAARAMGLALTPDPNPEEASFVRTDHYSFVRVGVPSVSLTPGPGGPGAKATETFLKNHYHQPSDEIDLPIDWTAAARFVEINTAIARALADSPERPRWVKGDYFGTLYGGAGAK